jgi:hypothetical protein
MEKINNSTDKSATALELFGKKGATTGVILAETGQDVEKLEAKLNDAGGAAQEMADTQLNTLGGAIDLLRSAWEGFILKMDEAGGVGDKLRYVIIKLSENLDSILSTLVLVGKGLLIYKTRLLAIKIANSGFVKGLGEAAKNIKLLSKNADGASDNLKSMKGALKSIGWAAVIAGAVALAMAFWDVVSGAKALRVEASKMKQTMDNATASSNEFLDKLNEKQDRRIKKLEDERKLGNITNAQLLEGKKKIIEQTKKEISLAVDSVKARRNKKTEELQAIQEEIKALKKKGEFQMNFEAGALAESTGLLGIVTTEAEEKALRLSRAEQQLTADIDAQTEKIKIYSKAITGTSVAINDSTIDIEINTKETKENSKAKKEQRNEIELLLALLRKSEDFSVELQEVGRREFGEIDDGSALLRRNVLEAEYNILIADVNITEEERINLLTRQILAKAELEKLNKSEAEKQVIDQRALKQINDLTIKTNEEKTTSTKEYIDITTDYFIKRADERIAKIQEEIDAATKQADTFRALAENGNITAKESLAEQNRLIAEANLQKEQEEKRKQRILLVSSVLQAYNSNLESGDPSGEAFTKAITSTEVIKQFISALPTFLEGIEDTGAQGQGIDGKGGFHAVLHPNERVLTKEQNAKLGGVSNDYVAQVMEQHRLGNYMDGSVLVAKLDNAELVNGLSALQDEMTEVKKAILNQPRESNNVAEILSNYAMFENKVSSGGKVTTSRFKVNRKA